MQWDRTYEERAAAAACPPPTSAAGAPQPFALCSLLSALSAKSLSVSSSFREPETDRHPQVKRRFLVQPDLPREIVHELLDELLVLDVDELFQVLKLG